MGLQQVSFPNFWQSVKIRVVWSVVCGTDNPQVPITTTDTGSSPAATDLRIKETIIKIDSLATLELQVQVGNHLLRKLHFFCDHKYAMLFDF